MTNNIRKYREALGLSQAQLAALVGIKPLSVYRHEKGQRGLDQETIGKYAKVFNVEPSLVISNDWQKPDSGEINTKILGESIKEVLDTAALQSEEDKPSFDKLCSLMAATYKRKIKESKVIKAEIISINKDS